MSSFSWGLSVLFLKKKKKNPILRNEGCLDRWNLSYITQFSPLKTQKTWDPLKIKLFEFIFDMSFHNSKFMHYLSFRHEICIQDMKPNKYFLEWVKSRVSDINYENWVWVMEIELWVLYLYLSLWWLLMDTSSYWLLFLFKWHLVLAL